MGEGRSKAEMRQNLSSTGIEDVSIRTGHQIASPVPTVCV